MNALTRVQPTYLATAYIRHAVGAGVHLESDEADLHGVRSSPYERKWSH